MAAFFGAELSVAASAEVSAMIWADSRPAIWPVLMAAMSPVVSAGFTLTAFVIWFFFFAGTSPLPIGIQF